MRKNTKIIRTTLIGILVGVIAFPTISLGGTFVVSLIQGKTVQEAVQILAEQVDSLIGRVETVETKQVEQEETISEVQSIIDQQQSIIDQQRNLIEEVQLTQQDSQIKISKEEACRKQIEFFNQAINIFNCDSNSQWWDNGQIERTIDAIVICLQNQMTEDPWMEESGTKSTGEIMLFNEYSSETQNLIASTRFLSSDGKTFRSIEDMIVPGATFNGNEIIPSSINIEVVADHIGADYNIGPSSFTIPGFKGSDKYSGFYGKSNMPMNGGLTESIENTNKKTQYQDRLDQLIILNDEFKTVEAICEE